MKNRRNFGFTIIIILLGTGLCLARTSDRTNKKRTLGFEISAGMAYTNGQDLGYRLDSLDGELQDSLSYYGVAGLGSSWDSVTGEFKKLKRLWPINAAIRYRIKPNFILKFGTEVAFGSENSAKTCTIGDQDNDISHQINVEYDTSYVMPYVGCEFEFKRFAIYAHLGYGVARFSHDESYNLTNGANQIYYLRQNYYSGKGNGLGFALGGKFQICKYIFLKLEYLYLKTASVSGDGEWSTDNWLEGSSSGQVSGDFYTFEQNFPYSAEWVKNWDLYAARPGDSSSLRDIQDMALNFSSLRVMIGFRF